jgi:transcriptional regulator with XRE-family HTH domain
MKRENLKEYKVLSKNLIELRTANGYTQLDVAEKLKITYQSYQAYERGIAVPTLQNFIKLADLYDVSLDYLIGRKEL